MEPEYPKPKVANSKRPRRKLSIYTMAGMSKACDAQSMIITITGTLAVQASDLSLNSGCAGSEVYDSILDVQALLNDEDNELNSSGQSAVLMHVFGHCSCNL